MKRFWKDFLLRGLICASGGPVVLAIIYGILGATGTVETFSPREVCLGILTITMPKTEPKEKVTKAIEVS